MVCISKSSRLSHKNFIFTEYMTPDYPHKTFTDKRSNYFLLMKALTLGPSLKLKFRFFDRELV